MKKNTLKSVVDRTALKIAIVENRPMFRRGLAVVLAENWKNPQLLEVSKIDELAQLSNDDQINLVLIGLESGDEKTLTQQITGLNSKFPNGKIILYDYQGNLKIIPKLLRLGIFGYLSADFDVAELHLCISSVLDEKRYISNEIVWEYLNHESEALGQPKSKLSKMEEVVANYLTQGMSVSRIAETMNRQISTISTVKAKVFKKMKVANILDLKDLLQKDNSQAYSSGPY
jgi:two-component system invasion response regulator UvrY